MNCVIVHGCPGTVENNPIKRTYDKHWIPWIRKELNTRGIETFVPLMPDPWRPEYARFKQEFEKYQVDTSSILIGHSCGCAFLVRWLGETKTTIHTLILVAPWKINDEGDAYREAFYSHPIDPTIKNQVERIIMFTADNEEALGKQSLKIFHDALGGKVIELKGCGHYTRHDMGTDKFPDLLAEIPTSEK